MSVTTPPVSAPVTPVAISHRPGSFAVVTMQKEPVNSMDLLMWEALEAALDTLEADPTVQGVIFSSGLRKDVYSAGNDLLELFPPRTSEERYTKFWITSNRFLCKLHASRLVTVAAIRGACPAGGCILALCCDHRLMTPTGVIGLNEVMLGIPVPKFWGLLMARVIGHKAAESLLLTGRMLAPPDAKKIGLLDEVVDAPQLLPAAEQLVAKLVQLPPAARSATKANLRGEFVDAWSAYYLVEPAGAWPFLNAPATMKVLGGALARLSKSGAGVDRSKL